MATISDMELEHILSSLQKKEDDKNVILEDIGSKDWCSKMSMMEELNVQSALEAASGGETVWRSLAERNVLSGAVEDMVALEVWREEVLGRMLKKMEEEGDEKVGRRAVLQVRSIKFIWFLALALLIRLLVNLI